MSTTTKTETAPASTATKQTTLQRSTAIRKSAAVAPVSVDQANELLVKRPASELTRLVFMALLGCAACIALVGVVSEANSSDGTSPDDPPPAVIVN